MKPSSILLLLLLVIVLAHVSDSRRVFRRRFVRVRYRYRYNRNYYRYNRPNIVSSYRFGSHRRKIFAMSHGQVYVSPSSRVRYGSKSYYLYNDVTICRDTTTTRYSSYYVNNTFDYGYFLCPLDSKRQTATCCGVYPALYCCGRKRTNNAGMIAGIVLGSIFGLLLIGGLIYLIIVCCCSGNGKKSEGVAEYDNRDAGTEKPPIDVNGGGMYPQPEYNYSQPQPQTQDGYPPPQPQGQYGFVQPPYPSSEPPPPYPTQ